MLNLKKWFEKDYWIMADLSGSLCYNISLTSCGAHIMPFVLGMAWKLNGVINPLDEVLLWCSVVVVFWGGWVSPWCFLFFSSLKWIFSICSNNNNNVILLHGGHVDSKGVKRRSKMLNNLLWVFKMLVWHTTWPKHGSITWWNECSQLSSCKKLFSHLSSYCLPYLNPWCDMKLAPITYY